MTYDADTYVEGDTALDTYRVVVDGRTIAENYTTIYPKSGSAFLIYSRDPQQIEVELPDNWPLTLADQNLFKLTATGPAGPVPFTLVGSTLRFFAEGNTPYKLTN